MDQKKDKKPSRPLAAKRPPSDTAAVKTPRKRPNRSLSQLSSASPSSMNQNAPSETRALTAPTSLQQRAPSRPQRNGTEARVDSPTLPQPSHTTTPFLENRFALLNANLMMTARTSQMKTHRENILQLASLPGDGDEGIPDVPINPSGRKDTPSSAMTSSRPMLYTTRNGQKIPTRGTTTSATGAYSPHPRDNLLVSSDSQSPKQGRAQAPSTVARAQHPHDRVMTSRITKRAGDEVAAEVPCESNSETPSENAARTISLTERRDMLLKSKAIKFPKNRRRTVVVDDEESNDDQALIRVPTAIQQSKHQVLHSRSPSLSASIPSQQILERAVPPELWSIRSAMGDENWQTYVGLVEKLMNEEITEREFAIMTGRIFQMGDKKMEKMVQKMTHKMIQKMGAERGET